MPEGRSEQMIEPAAVQMDDAVGGADIVVLHVDDGPSAGTRSSSGELAAVPRAPGDVTGDIDEFIPGLRRYAKNILDVELSADREEWIRQALPLWNTFLQSGQDVQQSTSAIISSNIKDDINEFIPWQEKQGTQWSEDYEIKGLLASWNMFLQARAGKTLVTRCSLCLTIVGFLFYIVDMVSDIYTSMYYARNGQWWRAMLTLAIVYYTVILYALLKLQLGYIHRTGAADWLRYVASLLVNWPDVKQYGALCLLEWKMYKSPAKNARLLPEWHQMRYSVAYLQFTEGFWEACPQAILQLCLLAPDLDGDWTWTDYLRIAGASVSLCTAGAALVNGEKFKRIANFSDLPLSELVVLHVWAVPVTVSRLLSVALFLTVHPYWTLSSADPSPRILLFRIVTIASVAVCLLILQIVVTPFSVAGSITSRRALHAVHFLGNATMTMVWSLGTVAPHPTRYTAVICSNAVMFAAGLVAMELHAKYWPDTYMY